MEYEELEKMKTSKLLDLLGEESEKEFVKSKYDGFTSSLDHNIEKILRYRQPFKRILQRIERLEKLDIDSFKKHDHMDGKVVIKF